MSIYVFSTPQDGMRLKAFGATVRGGKSILKIELEIDDPRDLGHLLADLMLLQDAEKKAAKAATRPARKLLALPAPDAKGPSE
ncbi:hypothetical protein RNZ50_15770 [Paracoccaceae bacterium Fryx2]|nr:hypothetical protein [Paracoccaceae bacterium Fryx2]